MNRAALGLVGLLLSSSVAQAQTQTSSRADDEAAAREAALFGASEETSDREAALFGESTETSSPADTRDDAMFGSAAGEPALNPPATDRLLGALNERNDFLDIGGVMWLWVQALGQDDTRFADTGLSSPNFMDLYLDARPSDRVRAYARARMNYDPTVDESAPTLGGAAPQKTQVRLDQLWLKFDIYRQVFLTLGKQRVRWGAGRIWNPTDFLNPNRLDALDFLDVRLGVALLKVHVPIESLGWNIYAIANFEDASSIDDIGGALRAEMLIWKAEVTMSAALRKDRPVRLGADISLPIWDFDVRVEAALLHDVRRPFFGNDPDVAAAADSGFLEDIDRVETLEQLQQTATWLGTTPQDRSNDWIPQVSVGLEYIVPYNDDDMLVLALEYFYNDAGTNAEGTYLLSALNGGFEALYAGRHYASLAVVLAGPGDWDDSTFSLVGLANLSDLTGIARLNYTVQILTFLRLNAFGAVSFGQRGGEFRLGFRVPAVDQDLLDALGAVDPDLAAQLPATLTDGLQFNPPLWQLGATIVMDF